MGSIAKYKNKQDKKFKLIFEKFALKMHHRKSLVSFNNFISVINSQELQKSLHHLQLLFYKL